MTSEPLTGRCACGALVIASNGGTTILAVCPRCGTLAQAPPPAPKRHLRLVK